MATPTSTISATRIATYDKAAARGERPTNCGTRWVRAFGVNRCHGSTTLSPFGSSASSGRGNIEAWDGRLGDPVQLRRPASPPRVRPGCRYHQRRPEPAARRNLQTFNPMFPTGAYLNLANPIGPANFIQVHPFMDEWH